MASTAVGIRVRSSADTKGLQSAGFAVGALFAATGAAAAVATKLANDTAAAAEEIRKWSLMVGVGTEELQKFEVAAKRSGVEVEVVRDLFKDLPDRLLEANRGTASFTEQFKQLGVSAVDNNGNMRSTQDVLMDIADAAKSGRIPMQTLTGAMDALLGDVGTRAIPLLLQGSERIKQFGKEAERTGEILSDTAIASAREYTAQIELLQGSFLGLRNILGGELMPQFAELGKAANDSLRPFNIALKQLTEGNRSLIGDREDMRLVFDTIVDGALFGATAVSSLGFGVTTLVLAIAKLKDSASSLLDDLAGYSGGLLARIFGDESLDVSNIPKLTRDSTEGVEAMRSVFERFVGTTEKLKENLAKSREERDKLIAEGKDITSLTGADLLPADRPGPPAGGRAATIEMALDDDPVASALLKIREVELGIIEERKQARLAFAESVKEASRSAANEYVADTEAQLEADRLRIESLGMVGQAFLNMADSNSEAAFQMAESMQQSFDSIAQAAMRGIGQQAAGAFEALISTEMAASGAAKASASERIAAVMKSVQATLSALSAEATVRALMSLAAGNFASAGLYFAAAAAAGIGAGAIGATRGRTAQENAARRGGAGTFDSPSDNRRLTEDRESMRTVNINVNTSGASGDETADEALMTLVGRALEVGMERRAPQFAGLGTA